MVTIRFKVRLNPGRKGVFLSKLSKISAETERFLRLLGEDLKLESRDRNWLAVEFRNKSVSFACERSGHHTAFEIENFNKGLLFITEFDPEKQDTLNGYSKTTLRQYARIADTLDDDEQIRFGVYPKITAKRAKWRALTKQKAESIEHYISQSVECDGALQGKIYGLTVGGQILQFDFRDLASGSLVKCYMKENLYPKVIAILKERDVVVFLAGKMKIQRVDKKIEHIWVEKIEPAEKYQEGDLQKFFGCAPNLTGDLSTEEYISRIRSDDSEISNLH